jgi:hypothetical protein
VGPATRTTTGSRRRNDDRGVPQEEPLAGRVGLVDRQDRSGALLSRNKIGLRDDGPEDYRASVGPNHAHEFVGIRLSLRGTLRRRVSPPSQGAGRRGRACA